MNRHNLTSKHLKLSKESPSNEPTDSAEAAEEHPVENIESETALTAEESQNDPAFLNELSNQNWSSPIENSNPVSSETKPKPKSKENRFVDVEMPDLYDDKPSGIVGKNRRQLLTKIAEYKKSFPDILSKFRIKRSATEEELQEYLDECIAISEMDSVSQFVSTIAIATINGAEKMSARTNYNVTGLTVALQGNPEFNKCMKQLCLKYSSFVSVPPEGRMLLIIMSTALMIVGHNAQMARAQMNTVVEPSASSFPSV